MDLHTATIDERWLRRFMARLLSFAVLAEQAAGRSAPIRWLVLWILRRAETLMEDVVFDVTGLPPPALEGMAAVGNGREDALRLAARFRALAAMLGALLSVAWFSGATAGSIMGPSCAASHAAFSRQPLAAFRSAGRQGLTTRRSARIAQPTIDHHRRWQDGLSGDASRPFDGGHGLACRPATWLIVP